MKKINPADVLIYVFFALIVIMFIGPIIWMISLSLKTKEEIFTYPPRFLPKVFALTNYIQVLLSSRIPLYLWNSVKITVISVLGNLLVVIPAVFAFSRMRFKFRDQWLFIILMFQMISPLITAIPLYRYFVTLGLLNSHTGLIVIYITTQIPFSVWLLKGFFDSIPKELDESAFIDGCKPYQILFSVILPLAVPGIAAALVFNIVNCWGQFIVPFIFINHTEKFPIAVGILQYLQSQTEGEVTTQLLAAASVIALLPAMLIIIILQKFIVEVLVAGAVKE
ncbi:MAG: carbohydrate ABC transporter permease [Treponemataceae bacterium]